VNNTLLLKYIRPTVKLIIYNKLGLLYISIYNMILNYILVFLMMRYVLANVPLRFFTLGLSSIYIITFHHSVVSSSDYYHNNY